ncbi:MAG: hypothetical protein NTZ17_12830 [Phycisphaerae bacterium]|nr:hypothetical protein [Phycisphaerae bacterium]
MQEQPKAPVASSGWAVARKVIKTFIGVVLIVLGLVALLTPFTPGSWLALIGLEFLGLRVLLRDRLCLWAGVKPDSRLRRTICRVFNLGRRDATERKGRRSRRKP